MELSLSPIVTCPCQTPYSEQLVQEMHLWTTIFKVKCPEGRGQPKKSPEPHLQNSPKAIRFLYKSLLGMISETQLLPYLRVSWQG